MFHLAEMGRRDAGGGGNLDLRFMPFIKRFAQGLGEVVQQRKFAGDTDFISADQESRDVFLELLVRAFKHAHAVGPATREPPFPCTPCHSAIWRNISRPASTAARSGAKGDTNYFSTNYFSVPMYTLRREG